jgi:AhpD family alkylhydroperoxidase
MNAHTPVRPDIELPAVIHAFIAAQWAINDTGIELGLRHLILLRASQINGCGFCVKMHTHEAREDGEMSERLDRLIVWRHVDDFTPAEKAAFAWTEVLTKIDPGRDLEPYRAELARHFDAHGIAALTAVIGMINLWNRLQVAAH